MLPEVEWAHEIVTPVIVYPSGVYVTKIANLSPLSPSLTFGILISFPLLSIRRQWVTAFAQYPL